VRARQRSKKHVVFLISRPGTGGTPVLQLEGRDRAGQP
jgi:hypothetical protein